MSASSFSFKELHEARKFEPASPEFIMSGDGVRLSCRRYIPPKPRAVVLLYHGGGAHSGLGYQHLGKGLQTLFNIAVYTPDIRGHGCSGGARGDAPSIKQVWSDITTFIQNIRTEFPQTPIFLGGHSSGAGLVLNYTSQPERESVSGYILISPQLGSRAQTDRPSLSVPFAKVNTSTFIANAMSGGTAHGHDYAVKFNYPAEVLASDTGIIDAITVYMALALTPFEPHKQFAALDRPFGLWIGSDDELFIPEKVLAFADLALPVRAKCQVNSLPNSNHLSVLLRAHETIGPWITRLIKN